MTETHARTVLTYKTVAGKEPFEDWLDGLDKGVRARVRTRIARLRTGNFGDIKPVGEGVSELRLSFGAGYRVYLARRRRPGHSAVRRRQERASGGHSSGEAALARLPAAKGGGDMSLEHKLAGDYKANLLARLKCDADEAAAYLEAALEDGDAATLALAIRDVAEAYAVALPTPDAPLPIDALSIVMKAVGLRVSVTPHAA
jgi:putative addiction module killer protein